jgi:hypothetical protein
VPMLRLRFESEMRVATTDELERSGPDATLANHSYQVELADGVPPTTQPPLMKFVSATDAANRSFTLALLWR